MNVLARGQTNTTRLLRLFVHDHGLLADAYEVGFQVWDVTAGYPGSQVFPLTGWEDITTLGRFGLGSYYAFDSSTGAGWAPPGAGSTGRHLVRWRFKRTDGSPYETLEQYFDVLDVPCGEDIYCLVSDLRDEGLESSVVPDRRVLDAIRTWSRAIDRVCRQFFSPRQLTVLWDGTDSDTSFFSVPLVAVESLYLNESTAALDTGSYRVYSAFPYPDDRRNPRVKLCYGGRDIFSGIRGGRMLFDKGRQNQSIVGVWGFVEEDQTPPPLVRRAALKLASEKLTSPVLSGGDSGTMPVPSILGPVVEEWTDGHKLKYAEPGGSISGRRPGLSGLTNDAEVLDILKLYKGPMGVEVPVDWGL